MRERESPELLCCRASSCEEHSNFILSCNLIGQRENKSFYVTEIVFWLGFAGVIFGGTSDRRKYVCVLRLASGRISEFSKDSLHVTNPLSVSTQSSGKRRLILDLRFFNQFILKQKVKFEDYETALDLFQYGGYACSFDLKSDYHHVDIFPSHQRFLGFS